MTNANTTSAARRITGTLFLSQSVTSAAVIVAATVLPIVATNLSGDPAKAGWASAVISISSAPASFLWGILWERIGRKLGLSLGMLMGALGMAGAYFSLLAGSFWFFLLSMLGMGLARAATQLGRYIAADVNPPTQRGKAISMVVLGGTVGSVFGPQLVAYSAVVAERLQQTEYAGPFAVAAVLFLVGILAIFIGLNPAPETISQQVAEAYPPLGSETIEARPIKDIIRLPASIVAISAMVLAHVTMVMIMGITSLHMVGHGHGLDAVSDVIMAHTLGMFAFAFVSGWLADRWGRIPVILIGVFILWASFALAPQSTEKWPLMIALFLLGLGWNFCYVAGSALFSDQLQPGERARTQGFADVFIGLAAGTANFFSGAIFADHGYGSLNLIAAGLILVTFFLTVRWSLNQRRAKSLESSEENN